MRLLELNMDTIQVLAATTTRNVERRRLQTLTRAAKEDLPGFSLTPRDVQIIQAVHEYRALTAGQIAALFWDGVVNARCKLRLRLLYQYGYLDRDEQPTKLSEGRKPLVYFLHRLGAEYLSQLAGHALDWNPQDNDISYPFLHHLLATNDVRVAVVRSAKQHGWEVPTWLDEKTLKSPQMKDTIMLKGERGGKEKAAVVPDSYFRLETKEDLYNFFLECDMGTVTLDASAERRRDFARKIRSYLVYYSSGLYEKRYHSRDMRVITVTTSEQRMQNLITVTEAAGGKGRFWFTTFDRVKNADILTAPIWKVATREGLYPLL
jgi:Replication-relaxation